MYRLFSAIIILSILPLFFLLCCNTVAIGSHFPYFSLSYCMSLSGLFVCVCVSLQRYISGNCIYSVNISVNNNCEIRLTRQYAKDV